MHKNITAVIPVAGWGTRRLPITKTIEKGMLPVGNRPLVDYAVEDCVRAGIQKIILVVSDQTNQFQSYYGPNQKLEDYLKSRGNDELLKKLVPYSDVQFEFVIDSKEDNKYGSAIPVALAAEQHDLSNGAIVFMGDDFIYHPDGKSEASRLIESAGSESSLLGVKVPREDVSRYGVLQTDSNGHFEKIVEKPAVQDAPSDLINVSKYFMNASLLEYVKEYAKEAITESEYYITNPINRYVEAGNTITVIPAKGEYLDGGTLEGWLHANNVVVGV